MSGNMFFKTLMTASFKKIAVDGTCKYIHVCMTTCECMYTYVYVVMVHVLMTSPLVPSMRRVSVGICEWVHDHIQIVWYIFIRMCSHAWTRMYGVLMCRMRGGFAWAHACLGKLTRGCLHVLAYVYTCALCVHMCGVFAGYCVHPCVLTNDTCMSRRVCLHEHICTLLAYVRRESGLCAAWERAMCVHIRTFHNK